MRAPPVTGGEPLVRLDGCSRTYRRGSESVTALVDVSLEVRPSELLAVAENVALPLALAGGDAPVAMGELFERLGLAELADRLPSEVSLGEQQRTAVARALVRAPALVVLDEPTGNQDEASAERILTVLREACAMGSACVLATHDPLVLGAVDRVVRLHDGRLVTDEG